jgi:hypothetical protein
VLAGPVSADDDDEFDFLEDDDDEILIAPSDTPKGKDAFIDMGDEDPDWDMDAPTDALPEYQDEDPVEEFDAPDEEFALPEEETEEDIRGRQEDRGITLPTEGKLPLTDNYPIEIVAKDLDAIVVELPVLVALVRSDFESEFWVNVEVRVNGNRVGESRQLVTADSLSDLAASFIWIKAFVPVSEARGTVEFRVDREDPETGEVLPQFTASSNYEL